MRILVVDDDPSVRELVRLQLELEGHDVVCAGDGQTALDVMAQDPVDVLVLDVMMPVLNGWDVLERMRALTPAPLPGVVLLTAKDLPDDRLRARELGALALLAKPHDGQTLADLVRVAAGGLLAR